MVAYRSLPVSDLPNVDFPTLLVTASLPAQVLKPCRQRCHAARESVLKHRRPGLDDVHQLARSTQVTLEFVLSKSLDGPPWTCKPPSRRLPGCATGHADAAYVHESESRRSTHFVPGHHIQNTAASGLWTNMRDAHRSAYLHGQRRRAGAGSGSAEIRRACPSGSASARVAGKSGSMK